MFDQTSEHQLLSAIELQDPGVARGGVTVTRIFEMATEQAIPIATVSATADIQALGLDAVSKSLLERGLAERFVAVTPERPVEIDDELRAGWWLIHLQTGQTRDQLDTGKGGASVRFGSISRSLWRPVNGKRISTAVEDANLRQVSTNASKPFRRTLCGRIVNALLGATMSIASGIALANGDVAGAIKQLSPAAKVIEERQKLRDVAKAARNNGGRSCR